MRQYKLISADDHVQEPADTWQKRVPAKFRDRAPKVVHTEQGDAWVIEGQAADSRYGGPGGQEVPGLQGDRRDLRFHPQGLL